MKSKVLTVTLNPAVDKTIKLSNYILGKEHEAGEVICTVGGKGINVSRALKGLNCPNTATGFLGGACGHWLCEELKQEKILPRFYDVPGETRTNVTLIHGKDHQITRVLEPGPRIRKKDVDFFIQLYRKLITGKQVIVLSGRNGYGCDDRFISAWLRLAVKPVKKLSWIPAVHL